jgi:uncharacterized Zn-finger protein|tara:strand:- start:570 stop:719 length:150 start_codon:yes stop_codon:yes gene_type:complete
MVKEVVVHERQLSCTGELDDHPKVYYKIGKDGFVVCGYCSIKYIYKEKK